MWSRLCTRVHYYILSGVFEGALYFTTHSSPARSIRGRGLFEEIRYFTSESTNRKCDFMRELNGSYKITFLQCSFSDKELSEFIQVKKRKKRPLPVKHAVSHVGLQADGTWVLGSNVMCLLVEKKLQLNFANMFGSGAC